MRICRFASDRAIEAHPVQDATFGKTTIFLVVSVLFAAAQSAKEPYAPGLGEFMTATQLRHAKPRSGSPAK
jgi:hypothetical protein